MPNIIESLIPTFGGKTVFVTNQSGTEVFARAQSLKVEVKPESRPMEHPLESGAIITDHRILLPTEIVMTMVLSSADYKDVYKEIASAYVQGTLLIVQCRAGSFPNQLIQSIPHMEDAERYDALSLTLNLKQVLIAVTPTVQATDASTNTVRPAPNAPTVTASSTPNNATAVAKGEQLPNTPNPGAATMTNAQVVNQAHSIYPSEGQQRV